MTTEGRRRRGEARRSTLCFLPSLSLSSGGEERGRTGYCCCWFPSAREEGGQGQREEWRGLKKHKLSRAHSTGKEGRKGGGGESVRAAAWLPRLKEL